MSRYRSDYGSHDQLQELRKFNMETMRELDKWKKIATALVEANYEQDAQQMSRAVEAYEEAVRNG